MNACNLSLTNDSEISSSHYFALFFVSNTKHSFFNSRGSSNPDSEISSSHYFALFFVLNTKHSFFNPRGSSNPDSEISSSHYFALFLVSNTKLGWGGERPCVLIHPCHKTRAIVLILYLRWQVMVTSYSFVSCTMTLTVGP